MRSRQAWHRRQRWRVCSASCSRTRPGTIVSVRSKTILEYRTKKNARKVTSRNKARQQLDITLRPFSETLEHKLISKHAILGRHCATDTTPTSHTRTYTPALMHNVELIQVRACAYTSRHFERVHKGAISCCCEQRCIRYVEIAAAIERLNAPAALDTLRQTVEHEQCHVTRCM